MVNKSRQPPALLSRAAMHLNTLEVEWTGVSVVWGGVGWGGTETLCCDTWAGSGDHVRFSRESVGLGSNTPSSCNDLGKSSSLGLDVSICKMGVVIASMFLVSSHSLQGLLAFLLTKALVSCYL